MFMGGLLPQEYWYYSEHTVAAGRLFSRWIKPQTLQHLKALAMQQHLIFLRTSAAHAWESWWPLTTQALSPTGETQMWGSAPLVTWFVIRTCLYFHRLVPGVWGSAQGWRLQERNAGLFWTFDMKRNDKNDVKKMNVLAEADNNLFFIFWTLCMDQSFFIYTAIFYTKEIYILIFLISWWC